MSTKKSGDISLLDLLDYVIVNHEPDTMRLGQHYVMTVVRTVTDMYDHCKEIVAHVTTRIGHARQRPAGLVHSRPFPFRPTALPHNMIMVRRVLATHTSTVASTALFLKPPPFTLLSPPSSCSRLPRLWNDPQLKGESDPVV